jgi:hypothetical protein
MSTNRRSNVFAEFAGSIIVQHLRARVLMRGRRRCHPGRRFCSCGIPGMLGFSLDPFEKSLI